MDSWSGWKDDACVEGGGESKGLWVEDTVHMLEVLGINTTEGGP